MEDMNTFSYSFSLEAVIIGVETPRWEATFVSTFCCYATVLYPNILWIHRCVICLGVNHTWAGSAWPPVWGQGGRWGQLGEGGGKGGAQWLHCCTGFFLTSTCAAVESSPELSRDGGSRELLPRGQQWGEGSSDSTLLLLMLLSLCVFLLFFQLTSLLLVLSSSTLLLFLSFCQRRWWLALKIRGLLLPPGGALVPVLYDLLVWPQPTAHAAAATAEEEGHV